MPDLLAHVLVPWIGYKSYQLIFRKGSLTDMTVLLLGSLLPDIYALAYFLEIFGIDAHSFMVPLHTLLGSTLVAVLFSLMFPKKSKSFFLLELGVFAHFGLDSLILHVAGGMVLLFPFSWTHGYQFGIFPSDSWLPLMVATVIAVPVFMLSRKILKSSFPRRRRFQA
jgi:hypothetical protein